MNLQLRTVNFKLTDQIKQLIDVKISQRLDTLLSHLPPDLRFAQILIRQQKVGDYTLTFNMDLPGPPSVYAQTTHPILESAVIDLIQEIEKQVLRRRQ